MPQSKLPDPAAQGAPAASRAQGRDGRGPARGSSLSSAFRRCVGELGMWSACRLFLRTAASSGGATAVAELRDTLGVEFPLFAMMADAADAGSAEGEQGDALGAKLDDIVTRCAGLRRLVVVGLEADWLGPLLDRLPPSLGVSLLFDPTFPADNDRLTASWGDRIGRTDLETFQRHAGLRSALLTTVYGTNGFRAVVPRVWHRCYGDDVRMQFRHLIGLNVLATGLEHYPRWLVETDVDDFTDFIGGGR